jgi:hypothetical protein
MWRGGTFDRVFGQSQFVSLGTFRFVKAGVLRGEKSRFQLFGDTVNTAARMESTGLRNQIQVSVATAELLRKGGREVWLSAREDTIVAKGKGEMQTFWVATRTSGQASHLDSSLHHNASTHGGSVGVMMKGASTASLNNSAAKNTTENDYHDDKNSSNIPMHIGARAANKDPRSNHSRSRSAHDSDASLLSGASFGDEDDDDDDDEEQAKDAPVIPAWTTRMVEASKPASSSNEKEERLIDWHVDLLSRLLKRIIARRNITSSEETRVEFPAWRGSGKLAVEEVVDFISFVKVDERIASIPVDPDSVDLGEDVIRQLKEFMQRIAKMYQSNPFHNFEHASHVAMSTNKLFNRIVTPTKKTEGEPTIAADVFDYTTRIKYDPLVHFAVVLSAVFHDADHEGVSNMDLIRDKSDFAECYGNRSVAEQHSVEVAWELLMDPAYRDLQHCIYKDQEEFCRFRQIIVQMVIATDIFDKDLKAFRERRWKQAFEGIDTPESEEELQNLRATVMLEHTIQASDVGHAMQHWQ